MNRPSTDRLLRLAALLLVLPIAASATFAADPGWPRTYAVGAYAVDVYQPQVESWTGYGTLKFRLAVSVAPQATKDPSFGVVVGQAATHVDWDARTVLVTQPTYADIRFPAASSGDAVAFTAAVRQAIPEGASYEVSLDRLLANVARTKEQQRPVEVSMEPPPIFYRADAAILVVFTGEPSFQPVPGNALLFATNTNWTVVLDPSTSLYYLLDGDSWLTAPDLLKGPWTAAQTLPYGLYALPSGANWDYVRAHVPGHLPALLPEVVVSMRPAELIVTTGAPQFVAIPGGMLLYATNTTSDVFLDYGNSTYYFLTAGRWFSAPALTGPWAAATKSLPQSFTSIPVDSPKADVLASVPGTPQATEAVLQASIPHTAKVEIASTTISVPYDGAPAFAPIDGSEGVAAATNTSYAVFQAGGAYFCCHDGIWFQAGAATGPWAVCTKVPPALYSIPASSPYHSVTYVYVYDSTPTTVVTGYTAGYTGAYVADGLLVFGAGLWLGAAATWGAYGAWHYPACWYSYGAAAHYNYYDGGYVRGAAYYGPYGGAGYGARYNPATGTYARGAAAYGPYGAAGVAQAYNPWTGRGGATAQASTPYGSWGHSVVSDGSNWAQFGHTSSAYGRTAGFQTSTGAGGAVHQGPMGTSSVAHANGNVYAGHDGNVYKYDPSSGWDKHTSSGWQSTGWGAMNHDQLSSHPSSWSSSGFGGGETHQQLSSDAWGRSWGGYRSSGGGWGGGGGGRWGSGGGGWGGGRGRR